MDSSRSRGGFGARTEDRSIGTARPQTSTRLAPAPHTQIAEAEARHQSLGSRLNAHQQRFGAGGPVSAPHPDSTTRFGVGIRANIGTRPLYLHARYYDRPDLVRYSDRHVSMYYDPYNRLHHRIVWPSYYYPVCYPFGAGWYLDYMWPYYHRKYVFVSLGGWWPYDYNYMRYYWYGYHPYLWYGYYPVAREVVVGSDSYYTYNSYYGDDGSSTAYTSEAPLDPVTQARLRAEAAQRRAVEPAPQTLADTRFDEGVKSFEAGEYAAAAARFDEARRMSPQDMILPFAYAQALFAEEQYSLAADVLRTALQNVSPDREGVFFPRGLYANDDVLFAQIEKLVDKVDRTENDADLQLLLGYQLLGVGETGYAREPLERAAQDPKDAVQAGILLRLLDKMEKEAGPATKANSDKIKMPEPKVDRPAAATVGEMMSTAGQTQTTAPAEVVAVPAAPAAGAPPIPTGETPQVPPENKPNVQKDKPADAGKESTGPVEGSTVGPTQDDEQPAENNDNAGRLGAGREDNQGAALERAGLLSVPTKLVSSLFRWAGSRAPNYRADIALFTVILSLALAGVWIEWRLLGRKPV